MDPNQADIVIIGAGPAGLAAALMLARRGRPSTLVGPPAGASDTRTTALLGESVAALDDAGAWRRADGLAAPLRTMAIVDGTSRLVRARPVAFEATEIGLDAFGWNIPNRDLTRILAEAAAECPLIRRLDDLAQQVEVSDVRATVEVAGTTLEPRLIVAADGRRSAARQAAAIAAREWRYPQSALTVDLRHTRPHRDISTEFHTEGGPMTFVPLPGDRSSLVWAMPPGEAEALAEASDADLAQTIERRCQSFLGAMSLDGARSIWPMAGLSARPLAARRVALVGEAAHVFPPIGAQGFNLTIRDILGLVDAIGDSPDPGHGDVLERYHSARAGDVAVRSTAVDAMNRSLLSDLLPVQLARGAMLYALERNGPLRRFAMRQGLAPRHGRIHDVA